MQQLPASPAIAALESVLRQNIHFLNGAYPERGGGKLPRLQYQAGPSAQTSHKIGVALDIFLDRGVPRFKILAHHLIAIFVIHSNAMHWSQIIYERSNFIRRGNSVNYQPYTYDENHMSHIHIDWWRAGAIQGETVNIPENAMNGGFAQIIQRDLAQTNQLWMDNLLSPLDLRNDPHRLSVMRNVGS